MNQVVQHALAVAEQIAGEPPQTASAVTAGGNNPLFKITFKSFDCALKFYPTSDDDPRDRFRAEHDALTFLWDEGVRAVPQLVGCDADRRAILFHWIDGASVPSGTVDDARAMAGFLASLNDLRTKPSALILPPASETAFTAAGVIAEVEARFQRISRATEPFADAHHFVDLSLRPLANQVIDNVTTGLPQIGIALDQALPQAQRILSPSDFGTHNALRQANGELVFLDFEYFGWDDPVKAVSDAMIHPGSKFTHDARAAFLSTYRPTAERDAPEFIQRLRLLYPLYAIRWCLILLNEFSPDRWLRRQVSGEVRDRDLVLRQQLGKAQTLYERISTKHEHIERYL